MTRDEFTRSLPPVTSGFLALSPPFEFSGLSARVFPLRANLDALQRFCNGFLNFVPPEVGRFRASVPYAYLSLLDYGEIAELLTNLGWFAQVEVFFCIPVEWYKVVNGKWVFHDWAVITPFIYVDDDLSVPLGRTVYGFPKTIARVTRAPSSWLRDPVSAVTLAQVETAVFPELYQGKQLESRVFLEVERAAPMSNAQIPATPRSPMAPWVIASNLAQAMAGFGRDALSLAQSMRIFATNPGSNPAFVPEMLARMAPAFAPGGPGFVLNSLNLKQFRRSDDPARLCYQALTNGRMQVTSFNGGGLLGEERTLLGDVSGGYTIKLHEYTSLPIARVLGLEVDRRWRGDGVDVAAIKPLAPFWVNVDVTYQQGINLVSRTHDGLWRGSAGERLDPSQTPATKAHEGPLFNTIVGSAVDSVAGPFTFTDTTIRVMPLLAYRRKLEQFLDTYVNQALADPASSRNRPGYQRVRLSLWARKAVNVNKSQVTVGDDFAYVYMTASSFGGVTSTTNNIGDWATYELSFLIPVKWERSEDDGRTWTLEGVGVVPAYTFVDDTTAAVARTEIAGIATSKATFVRPESSWMSQDDASFRASQTLLRLDAEVIPALGVGQQAAMQPIVEISVRDRAGVDELDSPDAPVEWAEVLRLELGTKKSTKAQFPNVCKVARALALEVLGNGTPIALYTLKQFRDVGDPAKACYQSLVRVSRAFTDDVDIRELEETIRIRFHDFPTLDLVASLGLVARAVDGEGAGVTYGVQAFRPFYIHATIHESLGERLLSRAGTRIWQLDDCAFDTVLSDYMKVPGGDVAVPSEDVEVRPQITVDGIAEHLQDMGDPSQISPLVRAARERRIEWDAGGRGGKGNSGRPPITTAAARAALARVDPQMVIESILSREWGNCDEQARWRQGRRALIAASKRMRSEGSGPDFPAIEAATFAALQADIADRPGLANVTGQVVEMIKNMKTFTTLRQTMEQHLSVVVKWRLARSYGHRVGAQFAVKAPDAATLQASIVELVGCMRQISAAAVLGEPSPHRNLAPEVMGDFFRLDELLQGPLSLKGPAPGVFGWAESEGPAKLDNAELVERAWPYVEQLCGAAELARKCANVQREALLNKLSRVYQKPDFCIRRDSVGRERDRLLPPTLSWDEDWYYGGDIRLNPRPSQTQPASQLPMTADPKGPNVVPLAQNPDELDLPPLESR